LPREQPRAGGEVEYEVVAPQAGEGEEVVAHNGEALPGAGDGAFEPPVHRPLGQRAARRATRGPGLLLGLGHGRDLGLAPAHDLVAHRGLVTHGAWLVEDLALERVGQVLLRYPVVPVG